MTIAVIAVALALTGMLVAPLSAQAVTSELNGQTAPVTTASGPVSVYRFWSPKNSTHFYTASVSERDTIIASYPTSVWTYEGVAYNAFLTQESGTIPLYRFWSPRLSGHFYTASESEKNSIIAGYPSSTWTFEGVAFYVYPTDTTVAGTVAVSRFWSPQNQHHFYTASVSEKNSVIASYPAEIWTYEGDTFRVPSTTPSSASPPASATPASPATSLSALPRVPWYGGPAYYAKFPKAAASGWSDPSFFPISVFLGKPSHASSLKAIGINTYMGAEHDGSAISTITSQGISVIAQNEWTQAEIGNDARVVGWHASDECEMGLGGCDSTTEAGRLAQQTAYVTKLKSYNDGRFVQANFGNGVLGSFWAPTTMNAQVGLMDVSSVDKYAYTSPAVDSIIPGSPFWTTGKNPIGASTYGWLTDRMTSFSNATKPNWTFVETAMPFLTEAGARTITGDQIEGAVWNSIIHGASGIAYFQHNNNGCGTYSLISCGDTLRAKVAQIDSDVQSLAPVINTQSYQWTFGPHLETSLKAKDGFAYIFAMTDGATGAQTFNLPAGVTGTVTVVGENRTIPITGTTFVDNFAAEYSHHIYKIALG
ncbi:hypothetical protein ACFPJ4_08760 [Lysinimonas soli]|uniref:DUF5648 domain-containing protein n=1 Tax=Lysinimonas soli TaxID=1074233 RepID=A0ABW0NPH9_9MICO